ncbi:hypothetical protein DPMN_036059 [Dreissena polymorpha]|uniref:Uncharacterized protein n=1 Tax=Dreissena polymorpha TaxID=45954 RepID=A0A9D4RL48_DREPO|nr:hypothetical protein DPMN_036059 [Dreissena polymorpha]
MSVVSDLGGFEYGRSPRSHDLDLSSLLSLALLRYGVSPMFHIDVTHAGHIGVSKRPLASSMLIYALK